MSESLNLIVLLSKEWDSKKLFRIFDLFKCIFLDKFFFADVTDVIRNKRGIWSHINPSYGRD